MPGSGSVGSVGCFALHFDYSGAMEREPEAGATSMIGSACRCRMRQPSSSSRKAMDTRSESVAHSDWSAGRYRIHSVWTTWARLLPRTTLISFRERVPSEKCALAQSSL